MKYDDEWDAMHKAGIKVTEISHWSNYIITFPSNIHSIIGIQSNRSITHREPVDWSGKYPLKTHSSNPSPMTCSSIFTDQGNLFINYLDGGPHYLWSTRQNTESWEMHWEGQLWRVADEHSCVSLHLPETPQTGWFFKDCIQSWESRKIKWGKWPQNFSSRKSTWTSGNKLSTCQRRAKPEPAVRKVQKQAGQ